MGTPGFGLQCHYVRGLLPFGVGVFLDSVGVIRRDRHVRVRYDSTIGWSPISLLITPRPSEAFIVSGFLLRPKDSGRLFMLIRHYKTVPKKEEE